MKWSGTYDAVVIGGGPAGLTAAIALARGGARVPLFDARSRAQEPSRIETLEARLASDFGRLGVVYPIEGANAIAVPAVASTWSRPVQYQRPGILNPYGPSFHVERGAFRSKLAIMAAQAGVKIVLGGRAHATPTTRGWRVTCGPNLVETAFLIIATGRDALPIAAHVKRRSADRLVAAFGCATQEEDNRDLRLVIEGAATGWWYRCPSPNGYQLMFLSDADLLQGRRCSGRGWFVEHAMKAELARGLFVDSHVRIVAADTYCRDAVVGANVVLIGDAAMAGDPLSGQGVTRAVTSGLRAATIALSRGKEREAALAAYSEDVRNWLLEFLNVLLLTYGQVTDWPDSPFWLRRRERDAITAQDRLFPR